MKIKNNIFNKSQNLNNFLIPLIFLFVFILVFLNKTDSMIAKKIKNTSFDVIAPLSYIISLPINKIQQGINIIYNFKLLSKMISQKYALCELEQTIKLKTQYWKNKPGTEYNWKCGGSLASVANAVLKHFTNIAEDPYNPDFHGNVEVLTWSGTPYKDGMIALSGTRIRTRCRGKQHETTVQ